MLIGHIPAGYLISSVLARKAGEHRMSVYAVGIFAALFPDTDLLYFYFIDGRQHLHHGYWTHIPVFWLFIGTLSYGIAGLMRARPIHYVLLSTFFANITAHLVLDTVVGKIRWLYPFSARDFVFFHVDARHGWWVWNFVFHWTFALELALLGLAVWAFIKNNNSAQSHRH